MTDSATKKERDTAIEDLAGMTQRSFLHVQGQINDIQEQMATKEDLAELRKEMATKDDLADLKKVMATKEDLSRLEDKIDAKFDKLIERFDVVIESHEKRITVLERQR